MRVDKQGGLTWVQPASLNSSSTGCTADTVQQFQNFIPHPILNIADSYYLALDS